MKRFLFIPMLAVSFLTVSCSNDDAALQGSPDATDRAGIMTVDAYKMGYTDTTTREAPLPSDNKYWDMGDEVGLFLTEGNLQHPYQDRLADYSNIKATYNSGAGWMILNDVRLGEAKSTVYAYYPWIAGADPAALPVSLYNGVDYLYGQSDDPVNYKSNHASIGMKHALTELRVCLKRGNYTKEGRISAMTLRNMNLQENIVDGGRLDISTGAIVGGKPAPANLLWQHPEGATINSDEEYTVFWLDLVPIKSLQNEGDVRLSLTIDEVDFHFDFAKGTEWMPGYRNIYRATINSNSLEIGQNDMTVEPWIETPEEQKDLLPSI